MVRIRLQRVGAKNQPSYRVVVVDSRAPRDSAYIERIGHYNPLTNPETVVIEPHTQARLQHYVTRIIDGSAGGDGEQAKLKHV